MDGSSKSVRDKEHRESLFARSSPRSRRSMPTPGGATAVRLDPHAEQAKRHVPAMAGNSVSGTRPIGSKLTSV